MLTFNNPQGELSWSMDRGRKARMPLSLVLHLMSTCETEAEFRAKFWMQADIDPQEDARRPLSVRRKAKAAGAI